MVLKSIFVQACHRPDQCESSDSLGFTQACLGLQKAATFGPNLYEWYLLRLCKKHLRWVLHSINGA